MNTFTVAENKTIRVNGRDFLFLVADKAIFEMDPSTKRILADWSLKGEFTKEEVMPGLIHLPNKDKDELFLNLLQCRAIIPVNRKDSNTKSRKEPRVSIPLKTLILHLTDSCNLSCLYCYCSERGLNKGGKNRMDQDVARRAVDFLIEHSGGLQEVVLVFFGGEPLLNSKGISAAVDYACQKGSENWKKIDFALTTNGTLLTEEVIDFLCQKNIGITLSIDGFEEVHDGYRQFSDGSPSYGVILSKVKHLLGHAEKRPVVARVTLVENPGRVGQILDHLLGLGFIEVGFAPVTTGHTDYQLDNHDMDHLLKEFQKLSQKFLRAAREGRFFGFSNLIDLVVSLHLGEVMNYPCGAGLGLFSVDPQGRLYLCQRFTGNDAFCMGDIFRGFDQNKLEKFREEAEISNKLDCQQCWVRPICTGGCYHEAWMREGSYLKPNLHYCEWIKQWSEIGLKVYCQLAVACPEYLDMLCMSRGYPAPFDSGEHKMRRIP